MNASVHAARVALDHRRVVDGERELRVVVEDGHDPSRLRGERAAAGATSTKNCSIVSGVTSSSTVTSTVCSVSPGANVRTPLFARKSEPPIAELSTVVNGTASGTSRRGTSATSTSACVPSAADAFAT